MASFKDMVEAHDLTWMYSDDGRAARAGSAELKAIQERAKNLPYEEVAKIWNDKVDRTLAPGFRSQFYWPEPKES